VEQGHYRNAPKFSLQERRSGVHAPVIEESRTCTQAVTYLVHHDSWYRNRDRNCVHVLGTRGRSTALRTVPQVEHKDCAVVLVRQIVA
jgi:hypothetical protein